MRRRTDNLLTDSLIIVRGAGDISTGTIHRLVRAGFPVLALESAHPSAIRRKVAFSDAVYDGTAEVEGVTAVRLDLDPEADSDRTGWRIRGEDGSGGEERGTGDGCGREGDLCGEGDRGSKAVRCCEGDVGGEECRDSEAVCGCEREPDGQEWAETLKKRVVEAAARGQLPILVDPEGKSIHALHPAVVVDAILAKRNLGTSMEMAPLTIALGPGFTAGKDVRFVVETMRGHDLGRIIAEGTAAPNTGVPGIIGGYGAERVIHAPEGGTFHVHRDIGSIVEAGERIGTIVTTEGREVPVCTVIGGLVRGVIRDCYPVSRGFKIADVDPRKEEYKNCFTISDKARCIAGSVLELICRFGEF